MLKIYLSIFSVSLLLTSLLPSVAHGAVINRRPIITQVSDDTVVVTWQTDVPASSQVKYSTPYAELITPDYPALITEHQVKISGLVKGFEYEFIALSTTEDGAVVNSPLAQFTLSSRFDAQSIDSTESVQSPKSNSTNPLRFVSLVSNAIDGQRNLAVGEFEKLRESALRPSWIGMALLAAIITFVIILLEDLSFIFIVHWILLLLSWKTWRRRRNKHGFFVLDRRSNRVIPSAEVALVDKYDGKVLLTNHTNVAGYIDFEWPYDKPVNIRVTRPGYQAATETFDQEMFDIQLTPLSDITHPVGLTFVRLRYQLKHTLWLSNLVSLVAGSITLVFLLLNGISIIDIIGASFYLYLWFLYIRYAPKRFHAGQVIDASTQRPLPFVHVTMYRKNKAEQAVTDKHGRLSIAYPVPDLISLSKNGFVGVLRQTVPASAISNEPLMLVMRPKL